MLANIRERCPYESCVFIYFSEIFNACCSRIDFVDSTYRVQGCVRDVYTKRSNTSVWVHASILTPIYQSLCSFTYPSIKIICDLLSRQLPVSLDIKIRSKLKISGFNTGWFFDWIVCLPRGSEETLKLQRWLKGGCCMGQGRWHCEHGCGFVLDRWLITITL